MRLSEVRATISWKDNGQMKYRSPSEANTHSGVFFGTIVVRLAVQLWSFSISIPR